MLWTTCSRTFVLRLSAAVACVLGQAHIGAGQHGDAPPSQATSSDSQRAKLPDDVERVLWWLPEETETVVVSKGRTRIQNPWPELVEEGEQGPKASRITTIQRGQDNSKSPIVVPRVSEYPTLGRRYQDLILEPTLYAGDDSLGETHYKMLSTFFGSKAENLFLRAVWWEKETTRQVCNILVFSDNTADRLVKAQAAFPHTPEKVAGVHVLKVDFNYGRYGRSQPMPMDLAELGKPLRPDWGYLAAVRPNVYVAATSSEMLKIIIQRMTQRGQNRALPPEIPEWAYIDPTLPAWGVRHYRAATARQYNLSMLKWDPNAKGLVLVGGNEPWRFLAVRYISESLDSRDRFLRMQADWSPFKIPSERFSRIDKRCIEHRTRIYLSDEEEAKLRSMPADPAVDDTVSCGCMGLFYFPWLGLMSPPRVAVKSD